MNEIGKIPPQAIDLEKAILGAVIIQGDAADEMLNVIGSSAVFYDAKHQAIFEAIQDLYLQGNPIDMLTVISVLDKKGIKDLAGGDFYVMQLTQMISSAAHVEYHSRLVLQKYMARQVIQFSSKIISLAYDSTTDVFELLQRWQSEFDKVSDFINTGRSSRSFPELLQNLKKEVEMLTSNKEAIKLVGINTGFDVLNKFTGGYRKQDLVIIAARPGMGKTAYVLKCAIENLRNGVPVGFISLEMSEEQLTARSVAIDTNFHLKQLVLKGFEKPEYFNRYTEHQERMSQYPFYIDDSGKTDIADVVISAKTMKRKHGIKLLIIDYLQLMTDAKTKGNRETEISNISRRLKRLAKELDIPVIALSQLSRAVETRGASKRPMLSDLRESGSIEQDADMVQFLYRPDYYNIDMDVDQYDECFHDAISKGANAEVIVAKYRGGSLSTILLRWVGDKTKFVDVTCETDMKSIKNIDDEYNHNELPTISPFEAFGDSSDPPY